VAFCFTLNQGGIGLKTIAALILAITTVITGNSVDTTTSDGLIHNSALTYLDEYSITVNKDTNCVTVYQKDTTGNFTPVKAMICSVGKNKADTPAGTFKTQEKYTWRALFGDVYGQYATRINGHILFHSVYYEQTDPSTLQTEEYNNLGTAASAGCIRLTAADAKWIYDNCAIGTTVKIVESGTDPLPRPEAIKLGENASYPNWDPTDPNPDNPWKKENVKIKVANSNKTIKVSDNIGSDKLREIVNEGVTAYDTANNIIAFNSTYSVSPSTPGTYRIKYTATDCLGKQGEATATITVVDE
jgi:hypothetical protein